MKLKLFTKTPHGSQYLGEITLLAGIEFQILRRFQQKVDFFVNLKDTQRKPLVFQARYNCATDAMTMDALRKYGVTVFGNHSDIHYLLKIGKF